MNNIWPIFSFLKSKSDAGLKTALVTLTAVTGASTRNPGTHMAIGEDGSFSGSFSGGCVEVAVVSEALDVIKSGEPREVRFGAGSPYLDIRLPCGGSIDLLFTPIADGSIIDDIFDRIIKRDPLTIILDSKSADIRCETQISHKASVEREGPEIQVHHIPAARMIIIGHGPSVESLVRLSVSYGIDCAVLSPDPVVVDQVKGLASTVNLLKTPEANSFLNPDPWTACIFYFHDHDWEALLMKQALSSSAFYVGAMGSRKTHALRQAYLEEFGVSKAELARMSAPIGLIPSTRDPATLALSTLAEVVESYHRHFGYRA
ncbi:XdhC family protein [Parasphingorhabdus sp.]|uniref:XdhC family protein n=1 Tax=Parasphingorhabdus sp. TaxID=2709688 RepID=UPI003C7282B2